MESLNADLCGVVRIFPVQSVHPFPKTIWFQPLVYHACIGFKASALSRIRSDPCTGLFHHGPQVLQGARSRGSQSAVKEQIDRFVLTSGCARQKTRQHHKFFLTLSYLASTRGPDATVSLEVSSFRRVAKIYGSRCGLVTASQRQNKHVWYVVAATTAVAAGGGAVAVAEAGSSSSSSSEFED